MKTRTCRAIASGLLIAALLPVTAAHAQLGDLLKGGGTSGGTAGSLGNVAGVLEYCIKNNYLGGGSATSVKDSLMSKISGSPSSDSGYTDGAKGLLNSSDGKKVDLSAAGLKEQVTKQVCDTILAQGKSML